MKIKTAIIIGLIIAAGAAFGLINKFNLQAPPGKDFIQPGQEKNVTLLIKGLNEEKTFQSQFKEEMTAFGLLQEAAEKNGLNLKTKTYGIGILVEAIGEKENGQGGLYWMYYVNDVMPQVSSDKYRLKPGDKVEFRFENSGF